MQMVPLVRLERTCLSATAFEAAVYAGSTKAGCAGEVLVPGPRARTEMASRPQVFKTLASAIPPGGL